MLSLAGVVLGVMLAISSLEDVNVFWYRDRTVEVRRNREVIYTTKVTEPALTRNIWAFLKCDVDFYEDKIYISRDGLLQQVFTLDN